MTLQTPPRLTVPAVHEALSSLPAVPGVAWRVEGDVALCADLRFRSFADAMGFMVAVAVHAQRLDHHPEWRNVHDRVALRLSTHDAGGLTERDIELARAVLACAQGRLQLDDGMAPA